MSDVILEELVVSFDGSVVELFYAGRADSDRYHVAQLVRAELLRLDSSRGPTLNIVSQQRGGVSLTHLKMRPDQLPALQALVAEISQTISNPPGRQ